MAEQINQGHNPPVFQKRDEELYAQIAAGDEVQVTTKRNKSSFVMAFMVEYMRWTLLIDEKKRRYQKFFHFLAVIWAMMMSLLYTFGIAALCVLVVSYMRFPSIVQKYLEENGVLYERMEIPGYIVSQIDLYNLHDKDNTYKIDRLSVSSTFSDFLNKRARSVSVKGVQVSLDKTKKNSSNIFSVLTRLNHRADTGGGLRIDSLEISDATLTFKGQDYTVPVSFSMTGVYGRETNLSAFITINEPNLKIHGPLSVRDNDQGMRWDLSIQSGQFAFPGRPLEKLNGQLSAQMKHVQLHSITADLTMDSERLQKGFKVFLEKGKDAFEGKVTLNWVDTSVKSKPVERTRFGLELTGLSISTSGEIETKQPLNVEFSSVYNPDFQIQSATGTLKGILSCRLFDNCSYELNAPSTFVFKSIQVLDQGYIVKNERPVSITFEPTKNFIYTALKKGLLQFDFNTNFFNFKGKQLESKGEVSITAGRSRIWGDFNFLNKILKVDMSLPKLYYKNPSVELKNAAFTSKDAFGRNSQSYLSGSVALTNNPYFKTPFDLRYSSEKGISNIVLGLENNQIQALFNGRFDLTMGTIDGQLVIPEIDLGKLKQPLNRISSLFPKDIKDIKGRVTAYGRLSGNTYNQLNGPFFISISDLSLRTDKLDIDHLSTALSLRTLNPFVTEPGQRVYIGQINSFIPILNVEATLKTEENYAQLNELAAEIAGVKLHSGETLVPYKDVGTLIYLRNQDDGLSNVIKEFRLKNWALSGDAKGSILLPLEVKNMVLGVKNAMIQLSDAVLRYTGNPGEKPAFMGKNDRMSIRSGTISIDSNPNSLEEIKVSFILDTLLEPQKVKKNIRDVFVGKLSRVAKFLKSDSYKVPSDILANIRYIQGQTKRFTK